MMPPTASIGVGPGVDVGGGGCLRWKRQGSGAGLSAAGRQYAIGVGRLDEEAVRRIWLQPHIPCECLGILLRDLWERCADQCDVLNLLGLRPIRPPKGDLVGGFSGSEEVVHLLGRSLVQQAKVVDVVLAWRRPRAAVHDRGVRVVW